MNSPLRLGLRHALHAVGAGFELQARERPAAGDPADDLLVATVLAGALAQHLERKALRFGVAAVHAKEVAGEEGSLIASRPGTYLEKEALVVARVLGKKERAQLRLRSIEPRLQPPHFFCPERAHAGVGVRKHLPRGHQVPLELVVMPQPLGQGLEPRVFHREVPELRRAAGDVGGGKQSADLLEAIGELFQALADGFLHGCDGRESRGAAFCGLLRGETRSAMRAGRGGSIVTIVRALTHPFRVLIPVLCGALVAGCATEPKEPQAAAPDAAALTIVAEIALRQGDCRTASETYAKAAEAASAPVARRASEVGLACEDLPAAWRSAQRWRDLAPDNREADAVYATVALKLYRIADARAAVKAYLLAPSAKITRPPPVSAATRPAAGARTAAAARTASGTRTASASHNTGDNGLADLTTLLLQESDPPEVFAALNGVIDGPGASPARLTLLGELAL